jgi:hypothetical protein
MGVYEDQSSNTELIDLSFINPNGGGTTTLDENFEPVYVPNVAVSTTGNFIYLSPTQIAARQSVQDDSRYKLKIKNNTENMTIEASWTVTIESVPYEITGRPRKPQFANGWITVYLRKKGA